ncbi:MAG: carboxypeptidase-like regulatory domain-containing protein [Candidatus Berkelbacteria bacterium]|nr:carboxypeptidase-like regulatory domain-containing protein [Candidatus Berkelbacteria bacterium]
MSKRTKLVLGIIIGAVIISAGTIFALAKTGKINFKMLADTLSPKNAGTTINLTVNVTTSDNSSPVGKQFAIYPHGSTVAIQTTTNTTYDIAVIPETAGGCTGSTSVVVASANISTSLVLSCGGTGGSITSVHGTITDANNTTKKIGNASVRYGTGLYQIVYTNSSGYYVLTNINSGNYTFTISATNYSNLTQSVTLAAIDPSTGNEKNFSLSPATVPTLSVSLTATPSTGQDPLSSTLTATASSSDARSSFTQYIFWWDCSSSSNSLETVRSSCGDPNYSVGSGGLPFPLTETINHIYSNAGTYKPKVIVTYETATAATQNATVTVTAAPEAYYVVEGRVTNGVWPVTDEGFIFNQDLKISLGSNTTNNHDHVNIDTFTGKSVSYNFSPIKTSGEKLKMTFDGPKYLKFASPDTDADGNIWIKKDNINATKVGGFDGLDVYSVNIGIIANMDPSSSSDKFDTYGLVRTLKGLQVAKPLNEFLDVKVQVYYYIPGSQTFPVSFDTTFANLPSGYNTDYLVNDIPLYPVSYITYAVSVSSTDPYYYIPENQRTFIFTGDQVVHYASINKNLFRHDITFATGGAPSYPNPVTISYKDAITGANIAWKDLGVVTSSQLSCYTSLGDEINDCARSDSNNVFNMNYQGYDDVSRFYYNLTSEKYHFDGNIAMIANPIVTLVANGTDMTQAFTCQTVYKDNFCVLKSTNTPDIFSTAKNRMRQISLAKQQYYGYLGVSHLERYYIVKPGQSFGYDEISINELLNPDLFIQNRLVPSFLRRIYLDNQSKIDAVFNLNNSQNTICNSKFSFTGCFVTGSSNIEKFITFGKKWLLDYDSITNTINSSVFKDQPDYKACQNLLISLDIQMGEIMGHVKNFSHQIVQAKSLDSAVDTKSISQDDLFVNVMGQLGYVPAVRNQYNTIGPISDLKYLTPEQFSSGVWLQENFDKLTGTQRLVLRIKVYTGHASNIIINTLSSTVAATRTALATTNNFVENLLRQLGITITNANISGIVNNGSAGLRVTIGNKTDITDADGRYSITHVQAGDLPIEVSNDFDEKFTVYPKSIHINSNQTTNIAQDILITNANARAVIVIKKAGLYITGVKANAANHQVSNLRSVLRNGDKTYFDFTLVRNSYSLSFFDTSLVDTPIKHYFTIDNVNCGDVIDNQAVMHLSKDAPAICEINLK